jgi:hypothetical protein
VRRQTWMAKRRLRRRVALRHVTPEWVLYSNFGCCIGTTKKSETYKLSGALRRREVPICELVDFTGFLLLCALSPGVGGGAW